MYAKLVATTNLSPLGCIRDICRLLTSNSPSLSLLGAFSQSSSVIVDNTPAGWTYVGSNQTAEQTAGDVAAIGTSTTHSVGGTQANIAISAPCLNAGLLKYAALTTIFGTDGTGNQVNRYFTLTGAQSVNSSGVCTNEGHRYTADSTTTDYTSSVSVVPSNGLILHVIANARHITLITENKGLIGLWETTGTDVHTYYNSVPMVLYNHANGTNSGIDLNSGVNYTSVIQSSISAVVFDTTNVNTGAVSGTRYVFDEITYGGLSYGSLYQFNASLRSSTINSAGAPQYQISPVYFQQGSYGYPVQFVTGVVPIYWTKPGLGNTGDTVDVNGTNYTYFNCGTSSKFGVIMTTGN